MKKIVASLLFILGFTGYAAYGNSQTAGAVTSPAPVSGVQADTTVTTSTDASGAAGPPSQSSDTTNATKPATITPAKTVVVASLPPAKKAVGQYVDGTYAGSSADAYYGYVKVQAKISGGKLIDVAFLSYPSDRRTSVSINTQAMPVLKSEAIQAQSANVNGVSGASDTSAAFKQSLAVALASAKV
jgi:uncharacterized protein with FMN-binding domain